MADLKEKPVDYVVISACGKGERLKPLTEHIPKYLVNPSNFNLITLIVNYWKAYTNNIILIIEEKYNKITEFYMASLAVNYKIYNINIESQGNCYTIYHALGEEYNKSSVLITWCDIFPTEDIPYATFQDNIIFTHGNECRYNYIDNVLIPHPNGNVIGIYYFKEFTSLPYENTGEDIIDAIKRYKQPFKSYEIICLSDVGDMTKFLNYKNKTKTEYSTRYYNKITDIDLNTIKKELAHSDGLDIIKGEINFYETIKSYSLTCFPKIYELGETYIKMEKINGIMLKDLPYDNYLEKVIEQLEKLHATSTIVVPSTQHDDDLHYEFNFKIKAHVEKIKPFITRFNYITHINDIQIQQYNINEIIDDLYKKLKAELTTSSDTYIYSLIHADSHFSNTMVESNTQKIVFIDPYGRFGHSMIYGSPYFDFCLILFSLTGFDTFSSSKTYHFDINSTTFNTNISIKDFSICKERFKSHNISWNICLYMSILHWAKFTFYTSNHILKSVASYYQAIYLYHKYILNP